MEKSIFDILGDIADTPEGEQLIEDLLKKQEYRGDARFIFEDKEEARRVFKALLADSKKNIAKRKTDEKAQAQRMREALKKKLKIDEIST